MGVCVAQPPYGKPLAPFGRATLLNSLVTVEGIVTKCTTVRPKV